MAKVKIAKFLSTTKTPNFKALAHCTQSCKKYSYLPYTLQLFLRNCTDSWLHVYVVNYFHNKFLEKCLQFCVYCVRAFMLAHSSVYRVIARHG